MYNNAYLKKIPQCIQHLVTIVSRWAGNLSQVCIFRLDTNNFKQPTLFLHTKNKKRTHYLFSYQHWLCLWTLLFMRKEKTKRIHWTNILGLTLLETGKHKSWPSSVLAQLSDLGKIALACSFTVFSVCIYKHLTYHARQLHFQKFDFSAVTVQPFNRYIVQQLHY